MRGNIKFMINQINPPVKDYAFPSTRFTRKVLFMLVTLVCLIGAFVGGIYYFFVFNKAKLSSVNTTEATLISETPAVIEDDDKSIILKLQMKSVSKLELLRTSKNYLQPRPPLLKPPKSRNDEYIFRVDVLKDDSIIYTSYYTYPIEKNPDNTFDIEAMLPFTKSSTVNIYDIKGRLLLSTRI